jgi:hypothetical protein
MYGSRAKITRLMHCIRWGRIVTAGCALVIVPSINNLRNSEGTCSVCSNAFWLLWTTDRKSSFELELPVAKNRVSKVSTKQKAKEAQVQMVVSDQGCAALPRSILAVTLGPIT